MILSDVEKPNKALLAWLIVLTATLSFIGSTFYMPSLPNMTVALNATNTEIQNTLTVYFAGFCISQLFYGPISDKYGRKPVLLFGVALSVLSGIASAWAPTMEMIMFTRLLQGIGLGAPNSLARSILRDAYTDKEMMKVISLFSMAISLAPAITPTMGGYLETLFGWKGVFVCGSIYLGVSFVLLMLFLPETNRHINPHALKLKTVFHNYWSLLKHKNFMGYTLSSSAIVGGFMGYGAATPFLYQDIVGLTPEENGWLAFVTAGAVMLGSALSTRVVAAIGSKKLTILSASFMFFSGASMLLFSLNGIINVSVILWPSVLFFVAGGFMFPVSYAEGFKDVVDGMVWFTAGILTAAGDTKYIMWVNSIGAWAFGVLPIYYFITVKGAAAYYIWALVAFYGLMNVLMMLARYQWGNWRKLDLSKQ